MKLRQNPPVNLLDRSEQAVYQTIFDESGSPVPGYGQKTEQIGGLSLSSVGSPTIYKWPALWIESGSDLRYCARLP